MKKRVENRILKVDLDSNLIIFLCCLYSRAENLDSVLSQRMSQGQTGASTTRWPHSQEQQQQALQFVALNLYRLENRTLIAYEHYSSPFLFHLTKCVIQQMHHSSSRLLVRSLVTSATST